MGPSSRDGSQTRFFVPAVQPCLTVPHASCHARKQPYTPGPRASSPLTLVEEPLSYDALDFFAGATVSRSGWTGVGGGLVPLRELQDRHAAITVCNVCDPPCESGV